MESHFDLGMTTIKQRREKFTIQIRKKQKMKYFKQNRERLFKKQRIKLEEGSHPTPTTSRPFIVLNKSLPRRKRFFESNRKTRDSLVKGNAE